MKKFLKVKDVAEQLNVSTSTVRHYTNTGKLKYNLTPNNQRVFTQEQINEFTGKEPEEKIVFYIRSSNGNKTLLDTQQKVLEQEYGIPEKIYQDKASGLNENRKGLQSLIKDAKQQKFTKVCITDKDRLTRFGFKYIEEHLKTLNITITILNNSETKTIQEELLQDFMSLVASFSGKFYRLRGYEQQKKLLSRAKESINEKENN